MNQNEETEMMQDGAVEVFTRVCEENQTRKILAIIQECRDIDEAKTKVTALLPA